MQSASSLRSSSKDWELRLANSVFEIVRLLSFLVLPTLIVDAIWGRTGQMNGPPIFVLWLLLATIAMTTLTLFWGK